MGDRAQLAAVGRGGVLDMAADLTPRVFDMTTVHRFTDPEYADLTVQLRKGEHPALLFNRLHTLGLVVLHDTAEDAQEAIARDRRDGDAITVATNDEARELNARIRDTRVRLGEVDNADTTTGSDDLSIGRGDVIQTRHNDSDLGVANRQTWIVQNVGADGTVWATENTNGKKRQRTVHLPATYVVEHAHLAYATTAYGVQGTTVPESHTILTGVLDASGVYVGMTRARDTNHLHLVAADLDDAREQFVLALARDRADRQAVQWERAAAKLDHQQREHQAEADKQQTVLASAQATAQQVRAEVTVPLIEQATTDGTAYLTARDRMWAASDAHRTVRGLRKRSTARTLTAATDEHRTAEKTARRRWGTLPQTPDGIEPWAATVAQREADADPRITETRNRADEARHEQHRLTGRQMRERADLRRQMFGNRTPSSAQTRAARWQERAEAARRDLAAIESLPMVEAAQLVSAQQEQAQHETAESAARRSPAAQPHGHTRRPPDEGLAL